MNIRSDFFFYYFVYFQFKCNTNFKANLYTKFFKDTLLLITSYFFMYFEIIAVPPPPPPKKMQPLLSLFIFCTEILCALYHDSCNMAFSFLYRFQTGPHSHRALETASMLQSVVKRQGREWLPFQQCWVEKNAQQSLLVLGKIIFLHILTNFFISLIHLSKMFDADVAKGITIMKKSITVRTNDPGLCVSVAKWSAQLRLRVTYIWCTVRKYACLHGHELHALFWL